jgi:hypothetical protein
MQAEMDEMIRKRQEKAERAREKKAQAKILKVCDSRTFCGENGLHAI